MAIGNEMYLVYMDEQGYYAFSTLDKARKSVEDHYSSEVSIKTEGTWINEMEFTYTKNYKSGKSVTRKLQIVKYVREA